MEMLGDSWNWISSSIWNDLNVLLQSHNRSRHWSHMVCWVWGNILKVLMWLQITWGLIRCKFWLCSLPEVRACGIFSVLLTDSYVILIFLHGPLRITRLYNMNWSRSFLNLISRKFNDANDRKTHLWPCFALFLNVDPLILEKTSKISEFFFLMCLKPGLSFLDCIELARKFVWVFP